MQKHWRGRLESKPGMKSDEVGRAKDQARGDQPRSALAMAESPLEVDRAILDSRRRRPDDSSDPSISLQMRAFSGPSQNKPSSTSAVISTDPSWHPVFAALSPKWLGPPPKEILPSQKLNEVDQLEPGPLHGQLRHFPYQACS